jgi:hypothetical protein
MPADGITNLIELMVCKFCFYNCVYKSVFSFTVSDLALNYAVYNGSLDGLRKNKNKKRHETKCFDLM